MPERSATVQSGDDLLWCSAIRIAQHPPIVNGFCDSSRATAKSAWQGCEG